MFGEKSGFKLRGIGQVLHTKVMLPAWVRLKVAPVSVSKQGYRGHAFFVFIYFREMLFFDIY